MVFLITSENPLHSLSPRLPFCVTVDVWLVVDQPSLLGDGLAPEDGPEGQQVPKLRITGVGPGPYVCWVIPMKATVRIQAVSQCIMGQGNMKWYKKVFVV